MVDNLFQNLRTIDDFRRADEEFRLRKQMAEAKLQNGGGATPAAKQLADEYMANYQAAQTAATPEERDALLMRNNVLSQFAKTVDKGLMMGEGGVYETMPGYGQALGTIGAQKKGMERQAEKNIDLVMNPAIASGEAEARLQKQLAYEPSIKAATTKADIASKSQAEAETNLPLAEEQAQQMIGLIENIRQDPGLSAVVGAKNPLKGAIPFVGNVMGTPAADFQAKLDQLGGKQFLEAFNSLKGGGQITEVEGQKATNAIGRMQTSQSEKAFNEALGELKSVVNTGLERARKKAGISTNQIIQQPTQPVNPSNIPMDAVKDLRRKPQTAAQFDEIFGAGAAKMVLGK